MNVVAPVPCVLKALVCVSRFLLCLYFEKLKGISGRQFYSMEIYDLVTF